MNLLSIASGLMAVANPRVPATVNISAGYTAGSTPGQRVPVVETTTNVPVEVQALTYKDLELVDVMNLNGTRRAIYVYGELNSTARPKLKGGDTIVIGGTGPNAGTWLVAFVFEQWPDWCRVAVTLQNPTGGL